MATDRKTYPCGQCDCDDNGRPADGGTWSIDGALEQSPICPSRLISPRSHYFLSLYQHYKNGILPIAGGLLDQPHSYVRAMTIIDTWVSKSGKP